MFRPQDPYSYIQSQPLYAGTTSIGLLVSEYKVALYNDVQVLTTSSVDQPDEQQFILTCIQRILLKNPTNASMRPIVEEDPLQESFQNYPAVFTSSVSILGQDGQVPTGLTLELLDYSPQTVNTAIQQNTSAGTSNGTTAATSSTTGNTYSQSSTYGVSVSVGYQFSGATASYEHSVTRSNETSNTLQAGSSTDQQASTSDTMSIKDWGSYCYVNPLSQLPSWIFGQEFPWNAIECRFSSGALNPQNGNQTQIYISQSMADNLFDKIFLYPPSELSMYGINFVTKSVWRIFVDDTASTKITLSHDVQYFAASHALATSNGATAPVVYMDALGTNLMIKDTASNQYVEPAVTLDLNVMGLDPIGINNPAAIIGFIPSRFIPQPDATGAVAQNFRTLATTNDLMIDDTTDYTGGLSSGFTASETCLTATWSDTQAFPYVLTLYFKIIDSVNEYSIQFKHWITGSTGVQLSFKINDKSGQTFTKYVVAKEGEGGEGNVLIISLRDLDFSSIEYHDYLQLGLNAVEVTMQPIDGAWTDCGYQVRAIAVQRL